LDDHRGVALAIAFIRAEVEQLVAHDRTAKESAVSLLAER
jgi:hypothetical protein